MTATATKPPLRERKYARTKLGLMEAALKRLQDRPLEEARAALRQAHFDEMMAHEAVVREAAREAARDSRTAMGLALVLVLATLPLLIVLRNRVLLPLNNLSYLMRLLARQDYSSAPTSGSCAAWRSRSLSC